MGYGPTAVPDYTRSALWHIDDDFFFRYFVGTSVALARELGALIINVPNRYIRSPSCCNNSLAVTFISHLNSFIILSTYRTGTMDVRVRELSGQRAAAQRVWTRFLRERKASSRHTSGCGF